MTSDHDRRRDRLTFTACYALQCGSKLRQIVRDFSDFELNGLWYLLSVQDEAVDDAFASVSAAERLDASV